MLWIPLAIGSYFLSGLSATIDKILLSARIPSPITYTYYNGILSIGVLVLAPMGGFALLPPWLLSLSLAAGILFLVFLYFFYKALVHCEASRIVPIIGGASPIILVFFSVILTREIPSNTTLLAIGFFILGEILLATDQKGGPEDSTLGHMFGISGQRLRICGIETRPGVFAALFASLFLALNLFLTKQTFAYAATLGIPVSFRALFIWLRLGSFFGALCMLAITTLRKEIFFVSQNVSHSSKAAVFTNKLIGAGGFFLLNLAIAQGPVTLINAMQGFQYLFIFLLAFILSKLSVIHESFDGHVIFFRLSGILSVAVGFYFVLM